MKKKTGASKAERRLKHWEEKLGKLLAKIKAARVKVEADYQQRIGYLRAKHLLLRVDLEQVSAAGLDEGEQLRAVESAWKSLEAELAKLTHGQRPAPNDASADWPPIPDA